MSLPDGFIPLDQAEPPEPGVDRQANRFDRFDPPATVPMPVEHPDWSACMMTIAERLYSIDMNLAALRQTLCEQAGMICAQTHLLAALLRLMAERLPPGEVEAALTDQVESAAGALEPELAPVFRLMVALVKARAGLGEPDAVPVVH